MDPNNPLRPVQGGLDRVFLEPLNAKFIYKKLKTLGFDRDKLAVPEWWAVRDIFFNLAVNAPPVDQWESLLRIVPPSARSLAAAVLVKCFGKNNDTMTHYTMIF